MPLPLCPHGKSASEEYCFDCVDKRLDKEYEQTVSYQTECSGCQQRHEKVWSVGSVSLCNACINYLTRVLNLERLP